MSLRAGRGKTKAVGFPRVSGDEPAAITRVVRVIRFSPRERG